MDKIFNKPFAVNGARVAIPENGTENERVSFDKGFTQPYEVEAPSIDNPAGQGFNILRPEMNEALYQLSSACNFLAENIDKWTLLTTENLNNITQPGRYNQKQSINATASNNYPVNSAGFLIVFLTGSYALTQIYKDWRTDKFYIRRNTSTTQDTNNWGDWDSFVLTSEFNNKITSLQNTDTNLNNNKEDKTKFTNGIINATTNSNLNDLTQNGFYWRTSNTGSPLPTNNGGAVIVNTNGSQIIQYFYTDVWNSANGGAWFRTRNAGGTWADWHHLENSEHAEATYRKIADSYTKTETNNLLNQKEDKTKISTQNLTTENLNNITDQGFFRQTTNANATADRNYPVQQAGTLINLIPTGSGNTYLKQVYLPINNSLIFVRARSGSLVWTNWERLALKSEVDLKRNISDSYAKSQVYTKTQSNDTFLTIANANSTYRKIADSYIKSEVYTKAEVNTRTPSLVLSKIGFTYSNIQNASFTIPNNSFLKTCNIQIMFRIRQQNNNTITFNFKNGNSVVASRVFERSSVSGQDYDVNDYISGLASFSITSALLGKTITPEIIVTNTEGSFLLNQVDLLITYGA